MSPPPGSKVSNPLLAVLAGGGTGAIEAMIMFPTEFVKTQLQLQSKKTPMFRGPWHCTVETIRQHGPLGLYRGLSTLVIGSIPKVAVRFFTFELLKDRFKNEQGKLTVGFTFLAGLGAGTSEAIFAVCRIAIVVY